MHALEEVDLGALYFFQRHHLPWLNTPMSWLTQLGNNEALFAGALLFIVGLMARGGRWGPTALVLAAAGLTGWGLNEGVKALVARPRPAEGVEQLVPIPTNGSFPSGHAMNAMAVYGTAALLAARGLRRRWAGAVLLTVTFAVVIGIGASRLYLGVHYLTDVLGGWCAGLALALLARWADERLTPAPAVSPRTGEGASARECPGINAGANQPSPLKGA
jgi:undecaprenyl-diphosphatase